MHRFGTATALLALSLIPTRASADELTATLSQPLTEVSHTVDLRIENGVATYVVRRTFSNTGRRADEAQLDIDLPMGAAVTGLRIRARNRWYSADLMEREEAAARYQELTSMGAWAPKDPALLQWVWADKMHLQVFPIVPTGTSTVEYTLTAPLHYRQGHYVVSYPRAVSSGDTQLALATPVLTVDPGHGDATTMVRVDGQPVAPKMPVVLGAPVAPPWVGEGEPDPGAGYGWSKLETVDPGTVRSAAVTVDVDHTYRGDLQIALVTPEGDHVRVGEFSGDDNDIHERFVVGLPPKTSAAGTWHLVVSDHMGLDVGTLDAWSLKLAEGDDPKAPGFREIDSVDVPVFIPDAPDGEGNEGLALIEIDAKPIDTLAGRYGRVRVDNDLNFLRLELEAAEQLEAAPKNASVVFVIDASHSTDDVQSQLSVVRGYMAHVPDAEAEVVLFRRFAERVTGDFLPADELWPALEKAEADGRLDPGNGSALEKGLELASRSLRGRKGPRRIVLLTDALLRTRFELDDGVQAMELAPNGTLAHIVVPADDGGFETRVVRQDSHALAPIPAASGGVLFGIEGDGWLGEDKDVQRAALDLVRPTGIDFFEVRGVDLASAPDVPETFREGTSYSFMLSAPSAPARMTIVGKIWNRDFRRSVRPSRSFNDATAAFVFSEDEHHELTREQMMTVAMKGRAVSPVTSYLAIEPGVRPSTIGIEGRGSGGGSGFGMGGGGTGLIGKGAGGGSKRRAFTLDELMDSGVRTCVAKHSPAAGWSVDLEVEATWREIVDVQAHSGPRAMAACVVEAAWAVQLTWNFNDERKTFRITVS